MTNYTLQQFLKDLDEPYAWPGGYPRYFITNDGEACHLQPLEKTSNSSNNQ
jgi:hypothetical protein